MLHLLRQDRDDSRLGEDTTSTHYCMDKTMLHDIDDQPGTALPPISISTKWVYGPTYYVMGHTIPTTILGAI